jgi:hypothetical protein
MAISIDGINYIAATDIIRLVGISRQTFWRWRQNGKIPAGYRYRDRRLFYTERELEEIRQYANKIEALHQPYDHQLSLFNGEK